MNFIMKFAFLLLVVIIRDLMSVLAEESRITNGLTATPGQFPHQVGLFTYENGWCSGSLIGTEWVLTAAHCFDGIEAVEVRFGSVDSFHPEFSYTLYPDSIINHAEYDPRTFENDIALVRIPKVTLTETVNIVRLPPLASSYPTYENEYATASGWGFTNEDKIYLPQYLQWVRMRVISNALCALIFPEIRSWSYLCTDTSGGSTCKGDSGGPLVLDSSGLLIGITSFNEDTCTSGYPAGFTRVTSYLDWIRYFTDIAY